MSMFHFMNFTNVKYNGDIRICGRNTTIIIIFVTSLITSLPVYTQRLLVLLFGTFRVVAVNSERARTGMSSEALGVSVAPSFFQSCVSDGKTAKMEDVLRFKVRIQFTVMLYI